MVMLHRSVSVASLVGLVAVLVLLLGAGTPVVATEPGDLPQPAPGVRVVDPDDRLTPGEEASLQAIADDIERATGGQVFFVVTISHGWTPSGAAAHLQARQLMDRWRIGRPAIDDGAIVLMMLDDTRCRGGTFLFLGETALDAWYGGSAYRVQKLNDQEVDPRLQACDVVGALRAAGRGLADAAGVVATSPIASHADGTPSLIALAFVLALTVALITIAWWWIAGRDPRIAAGGAIPLAAPPAGLTPALAATLRSRGPTDLALAASLVDLAGRGDLTFVHSGEAAPDHPGLGLARPDPSAAAALPVRPIVMGLGGLVPRQPPAPTAPEVAWSEALAAALDRHGGRMEWWHLRELVSARTDLGAGLAAELVGRGLLARTRRDPRILLVPAGIAAALAVVLASVAGDLLGAGVVLVAAGIAMGPLMLLGLVGAPPLTRDGVRTGAWLESFGRTLVRSMGLANSLDDALFQVRAMGSDWLDTPDRLLAWAVALGLAEPATVVLRKTRDPVPDPPWTAALDGVTTLGSLERLGAVIASVDAGGRG